VLGTPDNAPVLGSKLAHGGFPLMEKVSEVLVTDAFG
jgi:hypothetical protein